MRFRKSGLLIPFVAAALLSVGLLPSQAVAQGAVTVQLAAQNNSGITGTATLTPQGQQTQVVLTMTGAGAGPEPAHIHMNACANINPQPQFPLTPVANGSSTTTVNAPLSQIQSQQMAINVHKSPQEASVYVACGNIPLAQAASGAGGSGAPAASGAPAPSGAPGAAGAPAASGASGAAGAPSSQPGQLPRTGESDFGFYGLAALGALLLLSGAGLAFRRRPL